MLLPCMVVVALSTVEATEKYSAFALCVEAKMMSRTPLYRRKRGQLVGVGKNGKSVMHPQGLLYGIYCSAASYVCTTWLVFLVELKLACHARVFCCIVSVAVLVNVQPSQDMII